MKRAIWVLIMVGGAFTQAWSQLHVPDYWLQSGFLEQTPSTAGDAGGAMLNPAVWGFLKGPEAVFYWDDRTRAPRDLRNWALAAGGKGGGLAVQNWTWQNAAGTDFRMTDFHIGAGFGSRAIAAGASYAWSRGDITADFPRDNTLSLGVAARPDLRLSVGITSAYALRRGDFRTATDLGVRPWGTETLTLFGEAAMGSHQSLSQAEWAAGACLQPVPGVKVHTKLFRGGAFLAGLGVTFGGVSAASASHFDRDSKHIYNSYRLRVGYPRPDIFTEKLLKRRSYVKLQLTQPLRYRRFLMFDRGGPTLREILDLLNDVKADSRIAGVAIKITEEMSGSWEMLWEVREKLLELRESGVKVLVYLERGGMPHYYLASAADRLVVDPECMVTMWGFNMGRTYYADLFKKVGVGVDEWRFFTYKSAAESFSRTGMSDADREQRQALLDEWYEIWRADICRSRGLTEADFDRVVNEVAVLDADSLVAYRLADTTGRWSELGDWVKGWEGKKLPQIGVKTFKAMKVQDDRWGAPERIALIYALGPTSLNDGINARRLEGVIKRARENRSIKAVVFRADSPGGDVLPSDIVAVELKKTAAKKPVIVSQGQVAASGGYWISLNGDTIVASPWTVTGSIGVIGLWMFDQGFGGKVGLTYDHVQRGAHADLPGGIAVPFFGTLPKRPLTPVERTHMEKMMRKLYAEFVGKVAKARSKTYDEIAAVAEGRVWTGTRGKEVGLVDDIGGMERAIQIAREAAKISPKRRVEIVEMPKPELLNPDLFRPKFFGLGTGRSENGLGFTERQYLNLLATSAGRPLVLLPPDYWVWEGTW